MKIMVQCGAGENPAKFIDHPNVFPRLSRLPIRIF
jgi:hypothetical protein